MKTHLNTLFVTLEGAYLRKDGEAVEIRLEGETKLRVPLHNLDGIVSFGWNNTASAALMQGCHKHGVSLSFLSPHGKFLASTSGGASGNILLRREQYRIGESPTDSLPIASNIIAAKLYNCRQVLLRSIRDHGSNPALETCIHNLNESITNSRYAENLDSLRGIEGDAAAGYFSVFNELIRTDSTFLKLNGRTRRPPLDPVNALLSFVYVLLMHDCRSACESCGLDPQSGFLHQPRPGRASLALDLMEEFRPIFADRLVLSLINRKQITEKDFDRKENGAVLLKDDSRKKVLQAWQERKQEQILHPFLQEKMTIGLLPHIQARLLARYLRQDLDAYPAYLAK
jgi:CRISPR-associated protein Cas1